jgi:hypothetical protein
MVREISQFLLGKNSFLAPPPFLFPFCPSYSRISSVIYLWYSLLYLDCSPFFLACLCLCPFHSVLHSSIFILLSIFPLLHAIALVVFLSLLILLVCFLSLQHSVSILHSSLPSISSSNFSLSRFHSQPIPHVFLSTLSIPLKYFSCTFSTSSCSFLPYYFTLFIIRFVTTKLTKKCWFWSLKLERTLKESDLVLQIFCIWNKNWSIVLNQ